MKKLLVLLILIGVGLSVAAYWINSPPGSHPADEGYTFAPIEFGTLTDTVNATGQLQPRDVTVVSTQVGGRVDKIYPDADFRHWVEKDQPLIELDKREAQTKLDHAQTTVRLAQKNVTLAEAQRDAAQNAVQRARDLLQKDLIKHEEGDRAEFGLKAAERGVETARLKVEEAQEGVRGAKLALDFTTIRAPEAGLIIDRKVTLGQMVGPQLPNPLFTIARLDQMQINAQIAEGEVGKVRPGLTASFTVYAYSESNETFTGKVAQIRPVPNNVANAVFFSTIIDVANRRDPTSKDVHGWLLLPGMTATVDIQRREHRNVWKAATEAVSLQLDEHFQTPDAKAKIARWDNRKNRDEWRLVWIFRDKHPWPMFIRVGGVSAAGPHKGQTGIKDGKYYEVLEWDPDWEPKPDANNPGSLPPLIIGAPPVQKPGIFDRPSFKLT